MFTTLVLAAHRIPEHQPTLTSFPTVLTQYPPPLPTMFAHHHCQSSLPTIFTHQLSLPTIITDHSWPPYLPTIIAHHYWPPFLTTTYIHYHCPLSLPTAHCPDASKLMGATTNEPCVNILMHQHQLVRFQGFQSLRNPLAHSRSFQPTSHVKLSK